MYMRNRRFEPLDEARAKELVFEIAQGLKYLHNNDIIHRDIKLQNILMSNVSKNAVPIITDFGFAMNLKNKDHTCTDICGTQGYMAPELLNRTPYSLLVDIFSLGVLLFALVSSRMPFPYFQEKLTEEIIDEYHSMFQNRKLEFKGEKWDIISDILKDLITQMLEKDPRKRPTIDGVLEHAWFIRNKKELKSTHSKMKML